MKITCKLFLVLFLFGCMVPEAIEARSDWKSRYKRENHDKKYYYASEIDTNNSFYVAPHVGWHFYGNDRGLNNNLNAGFRAGKNFFKYFGLESILGHTLTDRTGGSSFRTFNWAVSAMIFAPLTDRYKFFVSVGPGGTVIDESPAIGLVVGGGFRGHLNDMFALRVEIQDYINFGDNNPTIHDLVLSTMLEVHFGPSKQKERKSRRKRDADGDGVTNRLDRCPDTPTGVTVDRRGCPFDADGDGVADHIDKCPGSAPGQDVDKYGCSHDSDHDGVSDVMDKCPGSPDGTLVDKYGCHLSVIVNIRFASDSFEIDPSYYENIGRIADFLKKNNNATIELQGHTDNSGPEEYNLYLSQKRAEAVRNVLITEYKIDPDRIVAIGYGEKRPMVDNDTKQNQLLNRRIEAILLEKK